MALCLENQTRFCQLVTMKGNHSATETRIIKIWMQHMHPLHFPYCTDQAVQISRLQPKSMVNVLKF